MGLFDFLRQKPSQNQVKPSHNQDPIDDFRAELRAKRLAEWQPVLSRGSVENAPAGFDHFNLNDVLIGTECGEYRHYLFDGDNTAVLIGDLRRVNQIVADARSIVPVLPDLSIQNVEIACDPFPDALEQRWLFSRLIVEGLTETGRLKKYPVSVRVETIVGEKGARLYYMLDGTIGKGSVWIHLNRHTEDFHSYSLDFINGVLSHVWKTDSRGIKVTLYNKNGSL